MLARPAMIGNPLTKDEGSQKDIAMPEHATTEAVTEAATEAVSGGMSPQLAVVYLVLFLGVAYWAFSGYRKNKDAQKKNEDENNQDG